MKAVNVGLLGLGTVGQGVVGILRRNANEISRRAGREIKVTHAAVRDLSKDRSVDMQDIKLTDNVSDVVNAAEVDILVELMGGTELARTAVLEAVRNGKHVVTANKALIAIHGNEIFAAAQKHGVIVSFEPAVAGGIPIIKAIREGLTANRINQVAGIINGTGNYILTEMRDKGRSFEEALAEAQALGYAEADPAFDVEGTDAAHKLTILSSIAFGIPLQFDAVYTEGIAGITAQDVDYAEALGYRIKHLGVTRESSAGIEIRVHPTLIPERTLLANVDGVMNAVLVQSDAVGSTLYYGPGAGSEPTGSSVVADLVDVVRTLTTDPENRVPHLAFQADLLSDKPVLPPDEFVSAYYLRLQAKDRAGVMADVTRILADNAISIESMLQKEPAAGEDEVPVVLMTHRVKEAAINSALKRIEDLEAIVSPVCMIRVESLQAEE